MLLKNKALIILTIVLIAQAVALRAVSRPEKISQPPQLSLFPLQFAGWRMTEEGVVDQETRDVLKADDLLSRIYTRDGSRTPTSFFVASFFSQRTGKAPHSPKNCLPGNGWVQEQFEFLPLDIPGHGRIEVNHYIVSNRESKSDVMYWYQSRDRVVASEYRAKVYVVADAIRYNRTDTALVRVVTPITGDAAAAAKTNVEFIQATFPVLRRYIPN